MREEESRRKKAGSVGYYKEWVKAWRSDTSKAAVEAKAKKTGEGVVDQLLDMLQHQSLKEYRQMQGTDVRIARDPLTMRMPEEEVKQGVSLNIFLHVSSPSILCIAQSLSFTLVISLTMFSYS